MRIGEGGEVRSSEGRGEGFFEISSGCVSEAVRGSCAGVVLSP